MGTNCSSVKEKEGNWFCYAGSGTANTGYGYKWILKNKCFRRGSWNKMSEELLLRQTKNHVSKGEDTLTENKKGCD